MNLLNFCVFGDSIGKGIVLQPETSRYRRINLDLKTIFGLKEIYIKNYAMFGCTISKVMSNLKRHASELIKYRHVFLELGGNDCDFNWEEIVLILKKHTSPIHRSPSLMVYMKN